MDGEDSPQNVPKTCSDRLLSSLPHVWVSLQPILRQVLAAVCLSLPALLTSCGPAQAQAQLQGLIEVEVSRNVSTTVGTRLQLTDVAQNSIFMSALIAWAMAQSLKVVTKFFSDRVLDWRMIFASGGMPSSHSAMCCSLTASIALLYGFSGPLFPITLAFTLIVMYDATSVRYHAGVQAQVLNVVVSEMLQGHPVSEQKLKELLGHTPLQVAGGACLGIAVAALYHKANGLW